MSSHIITLPTQDRKVTVDGPSGAFGEVSTSTLHPQVQLDAVFGLRTTTDVETFSALSGTTTVEDTGSGYEWRCATANNQYSYAVIRSLRSIRYRPGQGSTYRFTARYSAAVAGNTQRAGAFNTGNELSIGYATNQQFGVLRAYGGKLQIVRLTLTVGASGAETATVTLNGVAFNIAVTAGTTTVNAVTLSAGTYTSWRSYQNGATVTFISERAEARSGAYTLASTGTLTGTFSTLLTGAAVTEDWTYQSEFNIDKLDGTGESQLTLDPTKGNVYQVQHQYLGYGTTTFSIVNPLTGKFFPFHRIQYPNNNSSPNISMPIMKMGFISYNESGSTGASVYGASMAGFSDGTFQPFRNPEGRLASKTGVSTSFTNIISFRVRPEFKSLVNLMEVIPLTVVLAADGTKPAEVIVVVNPTVGTQLQWSYHKQDLSLMEYSETVSTYTADTGQTITAIPIARQGSSDADLKKLEIRVPREGTISIFGRATSGTTDITASLIWAED